MNRPEPDNKELFAIADLAAEFGISTRAIRFYETKNLLRPERVGGTRVFRRRDRARLILILRGKRLGFSLRDISEYLSLYDAQSQSAQVSLLVDKVDERLGLLEGQLADLETTIDELRQSGNSRAIVSPRGFDMFRALSLAFSMLLSALLLAGCVITSADNLVSEAETATPLPASFSMYPYKQGPGGYIRAEDAPMPYSLDGKTYRAAGESTLIRLVPLQGDTYLLAASGDDPGTLYGVLTYAHDVVAIRMILGDKLGATVDKLRPEAPAGIAEDIKVEDGGIIVTRRDTLDFLVQRLLDGKLPTSPLVAWIGPPDATPPMMIVEDKDGFHAGE